MRQGSQPIRRAVLLTLACLALAACSFSPEDGRPRGGGPGASSSNLPAGGVVPKSKVFSTVEP
ncbi:MAG: hypothetical protein HGA45_02690 [Chloroflexales bacterium]|nr:hypothetical protein [Chloroflexales bacterium]